MPLEKKDADALKVILAKGDEAKSIEAVDAIVDGLIKNRDDLKKEKDTLVKEKSDLDTNIEALTKERDDAKAKIETLEKDPKPDPENKELETLKSTMEAKIEEMKQEAAAKDQQMQRIGLEANLDSKLREAGVAPHFVESVKAMTLQKAAIKLGKAPNGADATLDGKTVDEHITDWVATDEATPFKAASGNTGAGVRGATPGGGAGGGSGSENSITQSEYDALTPDEQEAHLDKPNSEVVSDK